MKKVLSALLIMLMLIQTVSFAAGTKVYSEEDTKLLVDKLSVLGIFDQFDDDFFFGDNADVKRSEAAVVISNMLGMESSSSSSAEIKFFDVPQYSNYITAVNYVTGLGIMTGDGAGLFRPDDSMEIAHLYKALVVALGYGWKAEAYGGYPAGYVKVAAELGIADVVSKGINDTATRLDLLKMIDASLEAPICRMKSISGDAMDFEIDEDVTVLSEYHNIYFDEGVVENNKSMNISSAPEIDEDVVYIDGRKLYVNGVIDVYANFGYKVEYYYRYDKAAEANYLVAVVPSGENTETKISKADFDGFADGKITYYDEAGKEKTIKVSSSAVVLYNSEVVTNVADAINNFEGTLTVIDNNADKQADVIIAKNYTYDKVKNVKAAEKRIYANNKVFNLDLYETVDITLVETGEPVELAAITEGSIIGYATSVDGTKLMIDVLGAGLAVTIKSISADKFVTDDGKEYSTELLSPEQKALVKPNTTIAFTAIDGYFGVWAGLVSEAAASIGYLINIATETEFGETKILGVRILDVGGTIKPFEAANSKKLILNGKAMNIEAITTELARVKAEYQLGGDAAISQIVGYKLTEEGKISHLYTVDNEIENPELYLKFGFGRNGNASFYTNFAYSLARFRASGTSYDGVISQDGVHDFYTQTHMIPSSTPVFRVPKENQLALAASDPDVWYTIGSVNKDRYEGATLAMETYTNDKLGILPKAAVEYLDVDSGGTAIMDVVKSGNLMVISETYQTLNSDDGTDYIVSGLSESKEVNYIVDSEKVDVETIDTLKADPASGEEPGFTIGDIAMIELDAVNNIVQIAKIYDRETNTIHPRLNPANTTSSDRTCAFIAHAYNKPADGYGLEFFEEDLTLGVPGDERKLLLSLHGLGAGKVNDKAKTFFFYDDAQEKVYLGSTLDVVDYQQDPVNYTRIFIVHKSSTVNAVFYNR